MKSLFFLLALFVAAVMGQNDLHRMLYSPPSTEKADVQRINEVAALLKQTQPATSMNNDKLSITE